MILTNYHTHCNYCDGKKAPEDYVTSAVTKNFLALGFSSHAPLPFPSDWTMKPENLPLYADEIHRLRERYRESLQIYLGLEIDYLAGIMGPASEQFAGLGLDYTIGSVHMMRGEGGDWKALDGPMEEYEAARRIFGGDAKAFTAHYYALVSDMVMEHKPDIVGHFDVIMKNNRDRRYFNGSEPWYLDAAFQALEAIRDAGSVLEVNSGGLARGKTDFLYPAMKILKRAHLLGIPVMMNADAHSPDALDAFYEEGYAAIRKAGYREVRVLLDGGWKSVGIE